MFADRLHEIREKHGLNQVDMAKALGVSPSTYNKYETNNQIPRLDFIQNICKQFKVSADWLIGVNNQNIVDLENLTHSSIAKILIALEEKSLVRIYPSESFYFKKNENEFISLGFVILALHSHVLRDFFKDYGTLKGLETSGTISDEIFNDWLAGKLKEIETESLVPNEKNIDLNVHISNMINWFHNELAEEFTQFTSLPFDL